MRNREEERSSAVMLKMMRKLLKMVRVMTTKKMERRISQAMEMATVMVRRKRMVEMVMLNQRSLIQKFSSTNHS